MKIDYNSIKNKMKENSKNIIIGVMAVSLIGTSSIAAIKINEFNNTKKQGSQEINISSKNKSDDNKNNISDADTEAETAFKSDIASTSATNNINRSTSSILTTGATNNMRQKEYLFNKSITLNNGVVLTFKKGNSNINTNGDGTMILRAEVKNPTDENIVIERSKLSITDNNGNNLNTLCNEVSTLYTMKFYPDSSMASVIQTGGVGINFNESITSITATYTFDDGTVASTVLNLS